MYIHLNMKPTFVGTYLEPEDHKAFKVKAAQDGKSASALLRELALASLPAKKPKPANRIRKGERL